MKCKIISISHDHYHCNESAVYTNEKNSDDIFVSEYHGYEKELDKYLASGWTIAGASYDSETWHIILVK